MWFQNFVYFSSSIFVWWGSNIQNLLNFLSSSSTITVYIYCAPLISYWTHLTSFTLLVVKTTIISYYTALDSSVVTDVMTSTIYSTGSYISGELTTFGRLSDHYLRSSCLPGIGRRTKTLVTNGFVLIVTINKYLIEYTQFVAAVRVTTHCLYCIPFWLRD